MTHANLHFVLLCILLCQVVITACHICRTVTILFLFFIRACASGVIQAVYVYTPEVYPTKMRAFALGFHTAAARLGAITTPYIAQVTQYHPKSIYPHLNIHSELILFTE